MEKLCHDVSVITELFVHFVHFLLVLLLYILITFIFGMTTVNLTLLLGFSMVKPSSEISKSSKKLLEVNKKETVGKKAKNNRKEKAVELVVVQEDPVEKPANLFEVGSPQKFAHIEYELLPERAPFKVDINCWGNFAKVPLLLLHFSLFNSQNYRQIYCEDDTRAIRTIQINQIAWVPVKIKHFFKSMTKNELLKLQFHVIKFTIWSQQDKLEQQQLQTKLRILNVFSLM